MSGFHYYKVNNKEEKELFVLDSNNVRPVIDEVKYNMDRKIVLSIKLD